MPRHPYTEALLRTLRDLRGGGHGHLMYQIPGQPPSLDAPISGCPFEVRCERASDVCRKIDPELVRDDDVFVACHHPGPRALEDFVR
jgi:oligopeptide/dipeptide ABC transporter ATP-binding protein